MTRPITDLQRTVAPFEVISEFVPAGDQPAAINEIEKKSLSESALVLGEYLKEELIKIEGVSEVRGRGLLLGIVLEQNWAKEIANYLMAKGVLVNAPNENTIRIAPPLIVTRKECEKFVKIFAEVIANG